MSNAITISQVYMPGPQGPSGNVPNSVLGLRSFTPTGARQGVTVDCYSTPNDVVGAGGLFVWKSTDTRPDDGGTIIGSGTGRWCRQYTGAMDPRWFGATGDGTSDDSAAIAAAGVAAVNSKTELLFSLGTYRIGVAATVAISAGVRFAVGAMLSVATGVTIGLYGPVDARSSQQIFTSASSIALCNPAIGNAPATHEVWVGWWGAVADSNGAQGNGTDNTQAIRSAVAATATLVQTALVTTLGFRGATLRFQMGIYRCSDVPVTIDGTSSANIGSYATGHAYNRTNQQTPVLVTPGNGYYYTQIASNGTSGGSAPTWPTTTGAVVADNSLLWKCMGPVPATAMAGMRLLGLGTGVSGLGSLTQICCDFAEPTFTGCAINGSSQVTGLPVGHNVQIGSWVFVSNQVTAGNRGAWQVTNTSSTTATISDPTGEFAAASDVGGVGGLTVTNPTRAGIRIWSRDCVVESVTVTPANGRFIYAGVEDATPPDNTIGLTCNSLRRVAVMAGGAGSCFIHGWSHNDNPMTPGQQGLDGSSLIGHGDTCIADQCAFTDCAFAQFYDPDKSGQAKDIRFVNQCSFNAQSTYSSNNSRVGIFKYGGSWNADNPTISYLQLGHFTQNNAQGSITTIESEGVARIAKNASVSHNTSLLRMVGGRIAINRLAADGNALIWKSEGALSLHGVAWDVGVFASTFVLDCFNNTAETSGYLNVTIEGCTFPCMTPYPIQYVRLTAFNNIGTDAGNVCRALPDLYGVVIGASSTAYASRVVTATHVSTPTLLPGQICVCQMTGGSVSLALPVLALGQECTITIDASAPTGGTLTIAGPPGVNIDQLPPNNGTAVASFNVTSAAANAGMTWTFYNGGSSDGRYLVR